MLEPLLELDPELTLPDGTALAPQLDGRPRPAGAPGGLLVTPQPGGLPWLPVVPF